MQKNNLKKSNLLPPLPFGASVSELLSGAVDFERYISRTRSWNARYDPIGPAEGFLSQAVSLDVGGQKVLGLSHSPMKTSVNSPSHSFFIQTAGDPSQSIVDGVRIDLGVGSSGIFAPPGIRKGSGGFRSLFVVDVDLGRMLMLMRTMFGEKEALKSQESLKAPKGLTLKNGSFDFGDALARVAGLFNQYAQDPKLLRNLGLDDVLYRHLALLLRPEMLASDREEISSFPSRRGVDLASRFMMGHLGQKITLTDLEKISGLSARSLQYAFMKIYGCSPMSWLREQRLSLAHDRICSAHEGDTVTRVALDCGIFQLGTFSRLYAERFGRLPSEHLAESIRNNG